MKIFVLMYLALFGSVEFLACQTFVRMNQVGFTASDKKTAVLLSTDRLDDLSYRIVEKAGGRQAFLGKFSELHRPYGTIPHSYLGDFSSLTREGDFVLQTGSISSGTFKIGKQAYREYLAYPLKYLLEQRCGYNPVFDTLCHQFDGIAVDGPDSGKFVDVRGGYHDASDYLRFLITTSYTVGILLLTYQDYPESWNDELDALGKRGTNGVPDILDEARWGLDWMLKMYQAPGKLYHQSADDRDHAFWDLPFRDSTDYGWGKGGARPVYVATGRPQGLFQYKNTSTGLSNIAGRTAAVFALASRIWNERLKDRTFAAELRRKAEELYRLAQQNLGASESVPGRAPYRFHEKTYYDDLEWAAAELFRSMKKKTYLREAIRYADLAADTSWMAHDTTLHYEYFPYVNPGHYVLHQLVGSPDQKKLQGYYRAGLKQARKRANGNIFQYGVPPIWVSNNLATGLITQVLWYKKMSGSHEFDDLLFSTRDWLFGRNPWGQGFVVGVPSNGSYPTDPHTVVGKELGIQLSGALVDGPVYGSIFAGLRGLRLTREDRFAQFQSKQFVYHDDLGDYSSNEPTIDGSASMLYILAYFSR